VVAFTAAQIPGIANRRYPSELAGPLYPDGIPIAEEHELDQLIREYDVQAVVFSYSDISHLNLMHLASRVVTTGADFWLLSSRRTELKSPLPVISICAVRTGCGKSPLCRFVASELLSEGHRVVIVRHPMPYGDLAAQAVQRFARMEDLDKHHCTIEEREEYEHHLHQGVTVYGGIDYARILDEAKKEADIIIWDGGNNDTPFYCSDLEIVVVDPHRPGHELAYHPGEVNLRRANVVVINKVDTALPQHVETVLKNIRHANQKAIVIETACRVDLPEPELIRGRRVLVVEDGPTLTHGEMAYGAGVIAARQSGAADLVDSRPYAVGSIRRTYEQYPHLTGLLPAMGYSAVQQKELEETINRVPCDVVLIATPIDLEHLINMSNPSQRVSYRIDDRCDFGPKKIIAGFATHPVGV
jgi:predicted GTPase